MAEVGACNEYSTVRFAAVHREEAKAAGIDSRYYFFEYLSESLARVREPLFWFLSPTKMVNLMG